MSINVPNDLDPGIEVCKNCKTLKVFTYLLSTYFYEVTFSATVLIQLDIHES